jgi:hypothetical protein
MNKFKIRIKNYTDKPSGFWLDSIKDGKCIVTDNEEKATLFVDDTLDELSVYDHLRVLETKHGYIGEAVLTFKKGAEWQAEKMYSEEEVLEMFHKFNMHLPLHYEFLVKEQFKKK